MPNLAAVVVLLCFFLPKGSVDFYRSSVLSLGGTLLSPFVLSWLCPLRYPFVVVCLYLTFIQPVVDADGVLYVGPNGIRLVFLNELVFNTILESLVELDYKWVVVLFEVGSNLLEVGGVLLG